MISKRILLVVDDRLLLKLYQEKLEENGMVVTATRDLAQVPKLVADKKPDFTLLDVVFQRGNVLELVKSLRADPASAELPLLILPSTLTQLANDCVQAGATKVILPGRSPIASIIDTLKSSMGMPGLGDAADAEVFRPDDFWLSSLLANVTESINHMRHCLPGIANAPVEMEALHDMWAYAHAFAQRATLLPYRPFAQIATALDLLLHDLNEVSDGVNPSTVRTLGQALDFIATIANKECLKRLKDPSTSNMLVVDDEEGARRFITSALEIAGLSNDCAESPSQALEKLNAGSSDLIFLDVGLPGMNGFELCTQIRAIEQHKATPIVFITGMASFLNKAKASLSGGNDFVGKPFNLPELGLKALLWLCRGQLAMV
jgi:DNA-binding response OmpR family regulator